MMHMAEINDAPIAHEFLGGPRSVIATTTLRRGCEAEASVTWTLVPSG
jgi:hypothetical protein